MKRYFILLIFFILTTNCQAQKNSDQDGVKVGEMSIFRKLGGGLESKAAMQYSQTMQQAQQQNALALDSNPQLIRLRAIAKALIPFALRWNERAPQWKWEVNLIGSKQINAYCMPGGKIAFYTGILDTLKLTDDEVAIVMGHEIAHALREHGAERAGKAAAANFGIKLAEIVAGAKGYDPNVAGSVAGGLANVGMLKFSRDDETEADVVGLDIAARAGYDPRAGIALWKKMAMVNKGAPPQWLSTHPAGQNRIAEIQRHLPEVLPLFAKKQGILLANLPPYRTNIKTIPAIN
ncbi:M48 family metallopeptidase [Undibacterium sp. RTI2.1]|uniref:M48 family metallopeptidase n=1 Tax=unclassified Undibacterium TaxID=2630295 RepID=UPI002AB4C8C8|nr:MULTISPECIES: M48 family metallopeptidase [unclassified Undibacterium]MDY7539934.1 M48 family metallopeptidase [Undibacterium sp. 5I1]MEB0031155.1 M48 family metallopeptidase [Undibacterium sp. RTI2.1]MEB0116445.1 M48 family metallopeptidase [Undibacterium sp. RTI2.2]MEB0230541.1 M48 family metallopeptidase [Undibacterium sp. 10I3]MEB0257239.1 M48 family metallopeptidase [Undibacterium sp. 5I1]